MVLMSSLIFVKIYSFLGKMLDFAFLYVNNVLLVTAIAGFVVNCMISKGLTWEKCITFFN
jgi:hypothetical protein